MKLNAGETKQYLSQIEQDVLSAMKKPGALYFFALGVSIICFITGMSLWGYQIYKGIGVAGKNNPVGWALYITNFVFWVGIGHAGTMI